MRILPVDRIPGYVPCNIFFPGVSRITLFYFPLFFRRAALLSQRRILQRHERLSILRHLPCPRRETDTRERSFPRGFAALAEEDAPDSKKSEFAHTFR